MASECRPWMLQQILHLFHPFTRVPAPRQVFLRVAYRCFHRSLCLTERVAPFAPAIVLLGTPRGPKIISGSELRGWHEVELCTLGDLYEDGQLLSFTRLQEMGLPPGQFLLYSYLLGALRSKWGDVLTAPPTHLLIQYLHVMGRGRRLISWFADALQAHTALESDTLRTA
ncbi:hypothetical protein NDU88_004691 [Pleurodeles waltl]|uniref:Uncharacterized protein n=1 Tax=Pleurodeles waltl TaxID=8319 RepID=A0AAV7W5Q0_PLEWA|nr:hypothetical protein NDU88_004691 [Pleurodeles waltl]